jgi:hypothetical protein
MSLIMDNGLALTPVILFFHSLGIGEKNACTAARGLEAVQVFYLKLGIL